ncbi:hypothetical protein D3C72_1802530 [compost metagenome]
MAVVDQREDRRIADKAAVPVVLAVDADRLEQRGHAGRGQYGVDAQFLRREDAYPSRLDIGRAHVELDRAMLAQRREIDLRSQHFAQRIEVVGIELVWRQDAQRDVGHRIQGGMIQAQGMAAL